MKLLNYLSFLTFMVLISSMSLLAQNHEDPMSLQVVSAEKPIVLDGVLDETDWQKRYDYLVFGANVLPGDVSYTQTGEVYVTGNYTDTTLTIVKCLHRGLDLYISLQSNDQSVGKFGTSWEGDGLFMKIKDANGIPKEYKFYFNAGGTNPDIVFETNAPAGSGEGAAWKHSATIVNDTTAADSGYTAEMVIHLDQLGFTDEYSELEVMFAIFDPDGYIENMDPFGAIGSYYKSYWGSEWGDAFRTLKLADPLNKTAYKTDAAIQLDGQLSEEFWAGAESVTIGKGATGTTHGFYMQWNKEGAAYTDQSVATVKFMHKGTDLYIGVESDDKSVCKWAPGWEADGLFLWMTNKGEVPDAGSRMEIKNMFFENTQGAVAVFETNGNVPTGAAEGASYLPQGTVSHSESNGPDNGYSLEVVVHTDMFGYSVGDTVMLSAVIWDLDYSSDDVFAADTGDYAPNWWGAQWCDPTFEKYHMYRGVVLSNSTPVPVEEDELGVVKNFALDQNYPNPFNPTTKISYSIPVKSNVVLKVYDVIGREVASIINATQDAGKHTINFNASKLSSGLYFYTLQAGSFTQTKKMMLIK